MSRRDPKPQLLRAKTADHTSRGTRSIVRLNVPMLGSIHGNNEDILQM